jgi:hypothetical protein
MGSGRPVSASIGKLLTVFEFWFATCLRPPARYPEVAGLRWARFRSTGARRSRPRGPSRPSRTYVP